MIGKVRDLDSSLFQGRVLARLSQAGVCRGSDTQTIYVGDIDMYTPSPLEKPNT